MATSARTYQFYFVGDASSMTRAFEQIQQQGQRTGQTLDNMGRNTPGVMRGISSAGSGLMMTLQQTGDSPHE